MVYVRGQPEDFDGWRDSGNPGWGFADVLPYFRKSEDHDGGETEHHGAGGPMHVTDISVRVHPLCAHFQRTAANPGFPATRDFNGPEGEGVGTYQINTDRGIRASTARAFLRPALRGKNLNLETNALATSILFDGKRATGVAYLRDGHEMTATARGVAAERAPRATYCSTRVRFRSSTVMSVADQAAGEFAADIA